MASTLMDNRRRRGRGWPVDPQVFDLLVHLVRNCNGGNWSANFDVIFGSSTLNVGFCRVPCGQSEDYFGFQLMTQSGHAVRLHCSEFKLRLQGEAIGKVLLFRIATHVLKWQHRD